MKLFNLILIFQIIVSQSFGQMTCVSTVSPDPVAKVFTEKEATKLTRKFLEKKMLFSTIQSLAVIDSHPKLRNASHSPLLIPDILRKKLQKNVSYSYSIFDNSSDTPHLYPDMKKLFDRDAHESQADQKFLQDWEISSIKSLDSLVALLDAPIDERKSRIEDMKKIYVTSDSYETILEALKEIRRLQREEPEEYQAFLAAWKSTIPLVAEATLSNVNYDPRASHNILHSIGVIGSTMAIAGLAGYMGTSYFEANGDGPGMMSAVTTSAGLLFSAYFEITLKEHRIRPYHYIASRLKAIPSFVRRGFIKAQVKLRAKSVLSISDSQAEEILERNTARERGKLNELQDLTLAELMEKMKSLEDLSFQNVEEVQNFQRVQMYLMSALGEQFSIMSARQEKNFEKMDSFISNASEIAKLPDEQRRLRIKDITALTSDAFEFNIDVTRANKFVQEVSTHLNQHVQTIQSLLNRQDLDNETKLLLEQLLTRSAVLEGLREGLTALQAKTQADVEMLTKLSMGIMAGQVSTTLKSLSSQGRGQ